MTYCPCGIRLSGPEDCRPQAPDGLQRLEMRPIARWKESQRRAELGEWENPDAHRRVHVDPRQHASIS